MIAKLYRTFRGSFFHPQWLTDRLHRCSRIQLQSIRDARVLDIGSGNSENANYLRNNNFLIRLDYPDTNQKYEKLPDVFGDACSLPFAGASIDAVLLLEVLEHIPDINNALGEIHRVLRADGTLLLSVPFIYPIHDAPYDFYRFTIHGLRYMLQYRGFEITREIRHGNSFSVALQLFNLALLEVAYTAFMRSKVLGVICGLALYPLCLSNNLIGFLLSFVKLDRAVFGYFIVARRLKG